jgi:glycosyltransferase involved in cell wall biosynthesis
MLNQQKRLKVLTWHIHGSYLYYLTHTDCIFYLPYKEGSSEEGYGGRTRSFHWGDNVVNVPADEVKDLDFDIILFQSKKNYLQDQYEILTEEQRALPKIYLEHDPPREVPTDTHHVADDPGILLVHVTHFNELMWNNNRTPTKVIEHGVLDKGNLYTGDLKKGIVVINGIVKRGRRLGLDVFEKVKKHIPLDIVGMGSEEVGGLGEIANSDLPSFTAEYRFFFNPIRYTSLGLSVCEAMMAGIPVIGLATTEMVTAIKNDYSGFVDTDVDKLISKMDMLLQDKEKAKELGEGARKTALKRFNMDRFSKEWLDTFSTVNQQKKDISKPLMVS